ncbi:hypothetical protein BS47DRAFT_799397 [Hydnum rufescens UP504]|uniref:Uncharacterized protein n=1 Tax=Hydnum rufescens UP504 TaxID=1448309 RepID=A0A9P6DY21_9AGAM|nr:hypothetical protein BS47DRAFT_799397 [Hydnum rufescens UP504]
MIEEPLHYDSPPPSTLVCQFLHVGLLNSRGIENWLEIEVAGTSTRGTVTLAATPGASASWHQNRFSTRIDQALSLIELGIRIEAISDTSIGTTIIQPPLGIIFRELRTYGRLVKEDRPVQSPPETVGPISLGLITDGVVRHEVNHDASMETS